MRRPPILVAGASVTAAIAWAWALVTWLDAGSGLLAALDLLLLVTVGIFGLVLTHGRWARNVLIGLVAYEVGLALARPIDGWWWLAVSATAVASSGLAGPFLSDWLRKAPRADAAPTPAVLAPLIMLGTPLAVAHAGPVEAPGWLLAAVSIVGAWSYARAHTATLWALRLGYVPLGVWAAVGAGRGGVLILAAVVAAGALLWTAAARSAVEALEPRPITVKPVLPEMAPPEVLDAAGYDERGRPRP